MTKANIKSEKLTWRKGDDNSAPQNISEKMAEQSERQSSDNPRRT